MIDAIRKIRPATFGFVAFCFLLPFLTVSCPGGQYTFSGVGLVTGATLEGETMQPDLLAIVALLLALAGCVLSLVKPDQNLAMGGLGIGAALSLILMRGRIEQQVLQEGGGMVQVSFSIGWYLALFGLVSAIVFSYLLYDAERSEAKKAIAPAPSPDLASESEPESAVPEPAE